MYCPNCGLKIRSDSKFCPECGTRLISTPKTDPLIGHILSKRFKIIKRLGRGGMGAVYLARDQELSLGDKDIYIAVKTLPPEFTYDRRAIDDMRREVILARALTHENIVRIHDLAFDEELNIYYITMEYVEGKTMSELIYEKGHLSEEQAIIVLKHTLRALEYAKDKRIVHRDIKPSNIMIDFINKKVKVMDFGIARVIADTQSRISKTVVAGTPVYMSPEQHIGVGVSYASDIYSLGITVYEMLTGSPPYTTGDIYYQKVNTPPRRIAGISDWLWGLIRMMLSPDDNRRPQADVLLGYLDKKETPEIEVEEEEKKISIKKQKKAIYDNKRIKRPWIVNLSIINNIILALGAITTIITCFIYLVEEREYEIYGLSILISIISLFIFILTIIGLFKRKRYAFFMTQIFVPMAIPITFGFFLIPSILQWIYLNKSKNKSYFLMK